MVTKYFTILFDAREFLFRKNLSGRWFLHKIYLFIKKITFFNIWGFRFLPFLEKMLKIDSSIVDWQPVISGLHQDFHSSFDPY